MATRGLVVTLAFGLAGCSFTRFDDVQSNPPVVLLKKPSKMHSFGASLSTASQLEDGLTRVLVGGARGKVPAGAFSLGTGTTPLNSAVDLGACDQTTPCYLADSTAGLSSAEVGDLDPHKLCFVFGLGQAGGAEAVGLMGRCADFTEYTLPVPPSVKKQLIDDEVIYQDQAAPLALAADKDVAPALIAGASGEGQRLAWFYPPLSIKPVLLTPPGDPDPAFGAAVAAVRLGGAGADGGASRRVLAVGAPEAGHVWLFGEDGRPVGCFAGTAGKAGDTNHPGFGSVLSAGRVDDDELDDLVIADGSTVTVISGNALKDLAPAAEITCSLATLPPGGILASFGCGSRGTITGCGAARFGAALDVGDLDGDGDGEVVVGAPGMTVRGTTRGGAVLVYDAEGDRAELLSDQLFFTSSENGDELGAAVVAAHLSDRDVVVAGAPGNGHAAIFYCSALLGDDQGGNRCR